MIYICHIILWHVDSLLGIDHEISDYTIAPATARMQQFHGKNCTATEEQPMPRCYEQDKLGAIVS
jgi:hypothetical protein